MTLNKNYVRSNLNFYKDKRVFITGHTGFKGAWLTATLYALGAEVMGYALEAPIGGMYNTMGGDTMMKSVIGDVRDEKKLISTMTAFQPEIVIHLAAQAIVNDCFQQPHFTFGTNVMGTVNLFEGIRQCHSVKSVVIITTDKVYENKGDGAVYKEMDSFGGEDPYASSKTCMEFVTEAYKKSYLQTEVRTVGVATIRASNVLAGGDHVQSRLIPSILNSISENKAIELRNPHQTRPWQSVLDALNGYLTVARHLYEKPLEFSEPWNIGPTIDGIKDVLWVVTKMQEHYQNTEYVLGDALEVKESLTLGLDISKSLDRLEWTPLQTCDKMLFNVVDYFKKQEQGVSEREICLAQITEFFDIKKEV